MNSPVPAMTLGRLAKACGLARASLLHYEKLGLLRPSTRTASGYRLYGPAELDRLQLIRRLRDAGLPLRTIGELVRSRGADDHGSTAAQLIEARLLQSCVEIERLRKQQQQLARLLASARLRSRHFRASKSSWVELLRQAGMSEVEMHEWHIAFEADSPKEHTLFLRSLGLPAAEVRRIRRWSKSQRIATSPTPAS